MRGGGVAVAAQEVEEWRGVGRDDDEGIEDGVRVDAGRGACARRPAVLDVFVGVFDEADVVRLEPIGGGRGAFVFGFLHDDCRRLVGRRLDVPVTEGLEEPSPNRRVDAIVAREHVGSVKRQKTFSFAVPAFRKPDAKKPARRDCSGL